MASSGSVATYTSTPGNGSVPAGMFTTPDSDVVPGPVAGSQSSTCSQPSPSQPGTQTPPSSQCAFKPQSAGAVHGRSAAHVDDTGSHTRPSMQSSDVAQGAPWPPGGVHVDAMHDSPATQAASIV